MTEISYTKDDGERRISLTVKGHTGYGEKGTDIVCAAVSILTYTLAKNINSAQYGKGADFKSLIRLEAGDAEVVCVAGDDDSYRDLLRMYREIGEGYSLVAERYPPFVRFLSFGRA